MEVGSAEASFSLDVVDLAKKIYIFEGAEKWIEPLLRTFEPWRDKVVIISSFLSNESAPGYLTLDQYFKEERPDFVKIDAEGYEERILEGGVNIFSDRRPLRVAICSYHKQSAEGWLKDFLTSHDFQVETSPGYMIFFYDPHLGEPYLRRAVMRGSRA